MPVSRHRVYERVSKDEENAFLGEAISAVRGMAKPRGWTRRKSRGRPRRRGPGRPPDYAWWSLAVVLLLQQYLGLGYRDMAAHVAARPELRKMLGLKRAPGKSTLQRAHAVLNQGWLEELNRRVLAGFKKRDVRPSGT